MRKHTPWPWYWSDNYQTRDLTDTWSLIGADGFGILSCDGKCNSPQEVNTADARLIAAAPELLEALQRIEQRISYYASLAEHEQPNIEQWAYTDQSGDMKIVRAAIEKATGE